MRLKRTIDLVLVVSTAPLWLSLLAIVAALVRWRLGSPVFFRQPRPGLHGTIFEIVKFRTMQDLRDADGTLLPDEARLPAFGRWLRSTSLDELPELFNVLSGDMTLVGPRPLLAEYLDRYDARQRRRHEVPPGLTGWAQINGRNDLPWEDRLQMDIWYVDHRSLGLDLKVLLLTIARVLTRRGVSAPGSATMPKFQGTASPGPAHGEKTSP